jgi:hypothetical protein
MYGSPIPSSATPANEFFAAPPIESTILESLYNAEQNATIIDIDPSQSTLANRAREIVEEINRLLQSGGTTEFSSPDPEQFSTPEATATSIVDSITALFAGFKKSNPSLNDEETISRFMTAARSGFEKGFEDAFETLKALRAFDFEGLQEQIEQTRTLALEKFDQFEKQIRSEFSGKSVEESAIVTTETSLLKSARLSLIA